MEQALQVAEDEDQMLLLVKVHLIMGAAVAAAEVPAVVKAMDRTLPPIITMGLRDLSLASNRRTNLLNFLRILMMTVVT